MGKKNLTKTDNQRKKLEAYYNNSDGDWSKEKLIEIANEIGLSKQQVYKWLWDKRNQEKKESSVKLEELSEEELQQFHQFTYQRYSISTPPDLRGAVQFTVDPSVSFWARHVLKCQGWQLVKITSKECRNSRSSQEKNSFQRGERIRQDSSMRQIDYPHILRLNKFDLVNEDFEDPFTFMRSKGNENEVKQQEQNDNEELLQKYFAKKTNRASKNEQRKIIYDLNNFTSPNYKYSEDQIYQSKE